MLGTLFVASPNHAARNLSNLAPAHSSDSNIEADPALNVLLTLAFLLDRTSIIVSVLGTL